ncbi:MAG: hypothetical protein IJ466_00115 [Clostridia bacterium]|nr:hypothetical protein [Clostridia bacterium]
MEQAIAKTGRRSGWSESENKLLWETADEAQQQGLPLKAVFEQIARQTGRRPNSIRNYYYAQVRTREDGANHTARFVPFTQPEVDWLMEQVLIARAEGQSVRACLQKLSGGDHSLMLRYQNKYRAVIKSRPDYVRALVDRLNSEGVACDTPQVNHRTRSDLNASCEHMVSEAQRAGDAELARACDTLAKYLCTRREEPAEPGLREAVSSLLPAIKDFLALPEEARSAEIQPFCDLLAEKIGAVEAMVEG